MIDYRKRIHKDYVLLSEEDQEFIYAFLDRYLAASDEVRDLFMKDIIQSLLEFEALYGGSEE